MLLCGLRFLRVCRRCAPFFTVDLAVVVSGGERARGVRVFSQSDGFVKNFGRAGSKVSAWVHCPLVFSSLSILISVLVVK